MSNKKTNKDVLTEFLRAVWSEGDIEASSKYIAPRYKIHHDPGDPWDAQELDVEGYKERVRLSRAPFPDQRFILQELFAEGDVVVVTWIWTGTHKGDLPGFPASGRNITTSGATVYYFENDRIAGHWQITDRLSVFLQLQEHQPRKG